MRKSFFALAVLSVGFAADPVPPFAKLPKNLLTNDGVVLLAEAGLGERFLLELIDQKTSRFDTSAEALASLASLARQGLTEGILRAMVRKQDHVSGAPGGGSGEGQVALEPHLLRGKVVRQRMLVPDALGGNIGIMTMAPVVPKPVSAPSPEKREANADRWYLITQR